MSLVLCFLFVWGEIFSLRLLQNWFVLICFMLIPDKQKSLEKQVTTFFKKKEKGYYSFMFLLPYLSWLQLLYPYLQGKKNSNLHVLLPTLGRRSQVWVFTHHHSSVLVHSSFLVYSWLPCAVSWSISVQRMKYHCTELWVQVCYQQANGRTHLGKSKDWKHLTGWLFPSNHYCPKSS